MVLGYDQDFASADACKTCYAAYGDLKPSGPGKMPGSYGFVIAVCNMNQL